MSTIPPVQTTYYQLDTNLAANMASINDSIDNPLKTDSKTQKRLKLFLKGVCLEHSPDAPVTGQNIVISSTILKKFTESFEFCRIFTPRFAPDSFYTKVLIVLQEKMTHLIRDYHIFQMAVETLKMSCCKVDNEEPMLWLREKLKNSIEKKKSSKDPFLVSLGFRLPRPLVGHEMVGLVNRRVKGQLKLHIIDTSGTFKDIESYTPCSTRITYRNYGEFTRYLLNITPLQFPAFTCEKIAKLKKSGKSDKEDINYLFRNSIYTTLNNGGAEKHTIKLEHPLKYVEHQENYGCSFNFMFPLLCILSTIIVKEQGITLTPQIEHNLKILAETLSLSFKFFCFEKLNATIPENERFKLFRIVMDEARELLSTHSPNPFIKGINFSDTGY